MRGSLKEIKKRIEELGKKREKGKKGRERGVETDLGELERKVKGLEWRLEKEEREK